MPAHVDSIYNRKGFCLKVTKKKPNTRCIWFSAEQVYWPCWIKLKGEGGDGIRFYLASYDTILRPRLLTALSLRAIIGDITRLVMVSTKDSKQG
jgi:hypothetical protein